MYEARGALLALKGAGMRDLVDVGGVRFYVTVVRVA
jgi:hypothetical protein